jgi:oxygen-independent coproporphyrinogen-3 oxidase
MVMEKSGIPGLYIHIPFCLSRCEYCDFFSITDTNTIPGFLEALFTEIRICREKFTAFDTVYLGGGTPSLLSLSQLEALLNTIRNAFTILPDSEITIEVNPADWEQQDFQELHDLGINRINIGVQSFSERELCFLGRRHTSAQAVRTLEDAIHTGFENIGIDLIYSLPGQTLNGWLDTLHKALSFDLSHLSCYELELKPDTPMGLRYKEGEFSLHTEESQRDFFLRTSEVLEDAGYIHYEVSNFARTMETASRHNRKYWDHTPYLGLGPSAHSFKDTRRWWNHESVSDYLQDLKDGKLPISESEMLDNEQLRIEALFLGLRMKKGVSIEGYRNRYTCDIIKTKGPVLDQLVNSGLIEIMDGFIRPTRAGMAVADSLGLGLL